MVMVRVRSCGIYYVSETKDRVQECLSNSNPPLLRYDQFFCDSFAKTFQSAYNHTRLSMLVCSEAVWLLPADWSSEAKLKLIIHHRGNSHL